MYKNGISGDVTNYEIKQEDKRTTASFHLVGPWEQTIKEDFEQSAIWIDSGSIVPKEWAAVYYDNPSEIPAKKLRCDTVVTVPDNPTLPENSEGAILTEISGSQYVVVMARVVGDDFAKPWHQFFNSLLQGSVYEMLPKPCFEVYLNDGAEDGYWDIEIYAAMQPKHHQFIPGRCAGTKTAPLLEAKRVGCAFQVSCSCQEVTLLPVYPSDNSETHLLADRCAMSAFNLRYGVSTCVPISH